MPKITLFQPHSGQQNVLNLLHDPQVHYLTTNCGRQWGKSITGGNYEIGMCINRPMTKAIWVSKWYSQLLTVWTELYRVFSKCPAIKSMKKKFTIEFWNGSTIKFFQAHNHDAIRGEKTDLAVLDEFALYNSDAYQESIEPSFSTSSLRKVLFLSTPRGKGLWYNLFNRGMEYNRDKYPEWRNYTAPTADNPYVDRGFILDKQATLPEKIFKAEYEAQFIDDAGMVFAHLGNIIYDFVPKKTRSYYAGIDLGITNDYTVITVINDLYEVVDIDRFNQCELRQAANRLSKTLSKWGNPLCWIENNTYQGVREMMLENGTGGLYPFQTTMQSKKVIIQNLQDLLDRELIKVPDILPSGEILAKELEDYNFEYDPVTRNIKYSAPAGLHDDCVMSLALACHRKDAPSPQLIC